MNRTLISVLVASVFVAGVACAADDPFHWTGSAGVGLRFIDSEGGLRNGARATSATTTAPFVGPEDKAKLNEYRDLDSNGLIGNVDIQGANQTYYLRFFGENFGRDDQFLNLRGGRYGDFKYQLYQDKMPHNLSWNALTPFTGTGGAVLSGAPGTLAPYPPSQNPATWNLFNYGLQRDQYGGAVEFSFKSPWYFRSDYNETKTTGIRPQSGRLGTSANNGFMEFGAPVDYKTKNFTVEGGYSEKRGSISVSFLTSKFSNGNDFMTWPNFFMLGQQDTNLLPPDNDLKKLGINGVLRDLPMNSTLAGRYTYTQLTNNFPVLATGLMPTNNVLVPAGTGAPAAVGLLTTPPSSSSFSGEHKTTTGSLSLASSWARGVDSRLYWNYYDKKNESTLITYALGGLGAAAGCPNPSYPSTSTAARFCIGPYPNELFAFKKVDYGLDAGWRINPGNKVSGGLNHLKTEREGREDATETTDRKFWAEYKNTMLEDLSGRLKYQFLERRSDFDPAFPVGTSPFSTTGSLPTTVPYYYRSYDVSNFDQNQVKLVADWTPMPFLDLGGEYAWKKTDYKDLLYGRTEDHRDEYNLTVAYGDPKKVRVTGIFNYEIVEFNQAYRNGAPASGPSPNNAANFDWSTKNTQTNRVWGILADWTATERLAIKGSYTWVKTGGGVDFTSGNTTGAGGFNGGPLVNYVTDNTKKESFVLKADYKIAKQWSTTLGYTHEKYNYADDQMRGYQGFYPYYQNLGGNNNSWLSGAFANPSYKMDLIWVTATYRFE